jgi:hypothetical protein
MTDLLQGVRGVLAAELSGELSGQALIKRCTDVAEELRRAYVGESGVPHEVWHYLHDADIRVRDPKYAKTQLELLRMLVALPT